MLEAVLFGQLAQLPAEALAGKILLSAANYYPQRDGQIDLGGRSESEYLAAMLPQTRVVKAYNMMRAGVMSQVADGGAAPGLAVFFCGDDPDARARAARLIADSKFTPIDAGLLRAGVLFQTNAPLYDVQMRPDEAARALAQAQTTR